MTREQGYKRIIFLRVCGYVLCVLPTFISALVALPKIVSDSASKTISSLFIVAMIMCALPLYKWVKKQFKKESVAVLLWIVFILLSMIKNIEPSKLNGLLAVTLTGAIGNTIGAVLFFIAEWIKEKIALTGAVRIEQEQQNKNE